MQEPPADLAIVGAGVAGWTAARRAQQLGLRVVLLEKHHEAPGYGNAFLSGGVFHAAFMDPIARSADELRKAIEWATDRTTRPDVANTWSENCSRAIRFLMDEGGRFLPWGPVEWQRRALYPFQSSDPELPVSERWQGKGAAQLFTRMCDSYIRAGGVFRTGIRAVELISDGGAVTGVRTDMGDVLAANVLIADGGYHANKALGKKYYGTDGYLVRGAPDSNLGDGLQMALGVGADTVCLDQFYGHLQHRSALHDHRLWPSPNFDAAAAAGLLVTVKGQRLGTGRGTFMHLVHDVIRSSSPLDSWVIIDEMGWRTVAHWDGHASPANAISRFGARVEVANTLAELAQRIGMAEGALRNAVDEHNRERFRPFNLPQSGEGQVAPPTVRLEIAEPPFHAIPIVVGITFGQGGVLVNGFSQALRGGLPIHGLYVAGNAMGGLMGGPNHGYSGGWSQATVFGLAAAEHVANRVAAARD